MQSVSWIDPGHIDGLPFQEEIQKWVHNRFFAPGHLSPNHISPSQHIH
jgi:hypothetical protein